MPTIVRQNAQANSRWNEPFSETFSPDNGIHEIEIEIAVCLVHDLFECQLFAPNQSVILRTLADIVGHFKHYGCTFLEKSHLRH